MPSALRSIPVRLIVLILAGASADEDAGLRAGLDHMYRMEYAAAEETFLRELPPRSPARPFFAGLACLNRFVDWGDTSSLARAEAYWETLSPRGGTLAEFRGADLDRLRLYRGLAGFQLSYAGSLRGQRFRPAALALAARGQLTPLDDPEARAGLMLYDYYRGRFLEKLPFVNPGDFPAAEFLRAAEASPHLRETFLSALFWIHIDQGRFAEARSIAGEFLVRYPQNRLVRQMRGDAMRHEENFAGALAEYEKLREEYATLAMAPGRLPLGYYRAIGNLARIHAARGQREEAEARLAEWNQARLSGAAPWLPPSLKRDLSRL